MMTQHPQTSTISDRSCYDNTVFAEVLNKRGLMDDDLYQTYMGLFDLLVSSANKSQKSPSPLAGVYTDAGSGAHQNALHELFIFLDCPPEVAMKRTLERGRSSETGLELDYFEDIHEAYMTFIHQMSKHATVVSVDWKEFHPVSKVFNRALDMLHWGPGLYQLGFSS